MWCIALLVASTASHADHEEAIATHKHNIEPPLPSALGRGITGCFLEDHRHCRGIAGLPAASPTSLVPAAFARVSYGSIQPDGWLARQLRLQADGMSGWYQALFYPAVNQSTWVGGNVTYMGLDYMVTYWLNGNVPLALLLRSAGVHAEQNMTAITSGYIDYILRHQDPKSGQLGPVACGGPFTKMMAIRALLAAAEAANAARRGQIGAAVLHGLRELYECTLKGTTSGGIRWPSYVEAVELYIDAFSPAAEDFAWLYNMSVTWRAAGADWEAYYADPHFPGCPFPTEAVPHPSHAGCEGCYYHGVNTAEALKLGATQWRLWGKDEDATLILKHVEMLTTYHGHPQGVFGMDEFLAGRDPHRGTELCDVVEMIYSYEWSFQQVGERLLPLLDLAETLAFNALPGTTTSDLWQHQYDHQTNAIVAGDGVYCGGSNGADATVYGLEPHYPCCTVNLPQGWPKLASSAILTARRSATSVAPDAIVIVHLLPLNASVEGLAAVAISTEYPFGDEATIEVAPKRPASVSVALRVPGWAVDATVQIDGGAETLLSNGTLFWWSISKASRARVRLNPKAKVELGWGTLAAPAPSAVNYTAAYTSVPVPCVNETDYLTSGGAGVAGSKIAGDHDLRSGSPHTQSLATITHPINGDGHLLSSVSISFRYVAGYTPPSGTTVAATTATLLLIDALNGSVVASLWTSPPLGNYSFDHFTGYSPPVGNNVSNLRISWPRSLRVAIRFANHDRNVQILLSSVKVDLMWSSRAQPGPFAPSDLATPAANLAAVRRGPLLFALPLHPTIKTLRMPAKGGECESTNTSNCRSRDLEFARSDDVPFNYALVLGSGATGQHRSRAGAGKGGYESLHTEPMVHRRSNAAGPIPFDPGTPPITLSMSGRRIASWGTMQAGRVAEPPPASPVDCRSATAGCEAPESLVLVPFGSTQVRIAAFPWTVA